MKNNLMDTILVALFLIAATSTALYGLVILTWIMVTEGLWIALILMYAVLSALLADQFYDYEDE